MQPYEFSVEFVFDYMVILTDVEVVYDEDLTEEAVEDLAKANLWVEYQIDIDKLNGLQDVIVHDKNYGYYPPSERPEWAVQ